MSDAKHTMSTDADSATKMSRTPRRWLRFSLRSLLLAVTVFGVWLGFKVNSARRQHEAVQAILNAGGEVVYDFQMFPEGHPRELLLDPNAKPSEPIWLINWLGLDYFHNVTGVVLGPEHAISVSDFARLSGLRQLKRLQLAGTTLIRLDGTAQLITASDLTSLGTFHLLHGLMIQHAEIDGTCLHNLAPNVKGLALANTHVDDAGMQQIGTLSELEFLRLANTLITDRGMKELQGLHKLNWLDIRGTVVSDAAFAKF